MDDIGDDIGAVLNSISQRDVRNLPPNMKYSIHVDHFRPGENYKFPSKYADGCYRSCKYKYLKKNPWFVYSRVEDGLFCLPCVLFASLDGLGQFVTKKFDTWSKITNKFHDHNNNNYHKIALVRMEALNTSVTQPVTSVEHCVNKTSDSDIASNR